ATCDDFIDIKNLTFEPLFEEYVREAFNPVGIMIDAWADKMPPGHREFPVAVINDLDRAWQGDVRFRLLRDSKMIAEQTQPCQLDAWGSRKLKFTIDIPNQSGSYQVEAALMQPGEKPVRSLRDFRVTAQ
ncbi:MAG: hypothetical protein LLG00_16135, partial [Planctomycetaceae bacterium]|nr:hypothetical protein [Planctomycetaceae bacterium]